MESKPMPGQVNMVSMTMAPPSRKGTRRVVIVIIGSSALRKA